MKKTLIIVLVIVVACVGFWGGYTYQKSCPRITHAVAVVYPTKNNTASGVVKFTEQAGGLHIEANISGLTPGKHGFHVHEFGNCACDDAVCAGGHFNPTGKKHGGPDDTERHVGDFGNLVADEQGNAMCDYIDHDAQLNGPDSIIGRGIIIHADPDDLVSQPTGNAGARVGCGVVGIAQNNTK
jgi:Cu-Zn family superoxide dismutase